MTEEVVKANLGEWNFADRERELLESAKDQIVTWRLANLSRRALSDIVSQLSQRHSRHRVESVDELSPTDALQRAVVQLAMIVARETSAIVALVSTGHEREGFVHGRIAMEAVLRGRECLGDPSGAASRAVLQNRRHASFKVLAQRYGEKGEFEMLDRFAHANPGTLTTLMPYAFDLEHDEAEVELRPKRGVGMPANQLRTAAYTAASAMALLAEAFEVAVEIPTYMSSELIRYREHPLPPFV